MPRRVAIVGAAGRDFHDFNTVFRGRDEVKVVAFLAIGGQNIGELEELPDRRYPAELAGDGYPCGIPIRPAADLEEVVSTEDVDEIVLSYSDVSHEDVMHQASRALAAGADVRLIGPDGMMLDANLPVVAVDAVRTGAGKSQASQKIARLLQERGRAVAVIREPMPYGDLAEQRVQRFETLEDLDDAGVTVEEREEYERHIEQGNVVFAGVDYAAVLDAAEQEADIILWDGGNNELPFVRPDLHLVLADPHRAGHELAYHPGETNLRMADYVVINKENTASQDAVDEVVANVERVNPDAEIVHADSVVTVDDPDAVEGTRAVVVEDGPTMTHGGMSRGAGTIAAEQYGAEIVEPDAAGSIAEVIARYPHLGPVLPAMGYSDEQLQDLAASIDATDAAIVLSGTPIDLSRLIDVDLPVVDVRYRIENEEPSFADILDRHADDLGL
ncbi:MAG: cyclic 2,3-diphosphoglycerate synthase [Halodesulfurarchaeum sp.]